MAKEEGKPLSGREVLNRMAAAYHKASSYADAGTVHLVAEAGDKKIDEVAQFSVSLVRPNKLRLQAYDAILVCDGQKTYAAVKDVPDQVLVKPAPERLTLKSIDVDLILRKVVSEGFASAPPQPLFLLADDPLAELLRGAEEPQLSEPGEIEGRACYRVRFKDAYGEATFWVDQQTYVLRRLVLPTDQLRQGLSQDNPVERLSLVADFSGARIDDKVDPKAFEFQVAAGVKVVKFLVPPELSDLLHTAELLGKPAPDLKFSDVDGKPVTLESMAGKNVVLDFWATDCLPCRESLPKLEKVREQFKDNSKVAFFAVSVDGPEVPTKKLVAYFEESRVRLPLLRDTAQSAHALRFRGIPARFLIDSKGVLQDFEAGDNPQLAETLPAQIEDVLAGKNIYEQSRKRYLDQVDILREYAERADAPTPSGESTSRTPQEETISLPEPKTAPRSEPAAFKLAPLWKCAELKSPANVLALSEKSRPARLLVVEDWTAVAEVGGDGQLIALHKLNLAEGEYVGRLRAAAGADGKRYVVAFLTGQQRCHVLDENLNHVASYPEDALKNPHSGIADVELGDLDGDGKLKLYVSYFGAVGVQSASLDGKRLWANRSIANVVGIALGGRDDKGRRPLLCANDRGTLVVLDAQGQRQGEFQVPSRMLHWIVAADLRGDGQLLWCGLTAPKPGDNVAIGLSFSGGELWNYALPPGLQPRPIEPIVPGRITREGAGQWILPGPDGSIHFISADGQPFDKFNYGAILQGLATIQIDGKPVLVVSSANGLEAWKPEPSAAH